MRPWSKGVSLYKKHLKMSFPTPPDSLLPPIQNKDHMSMKQEGSYLQVKKKALPEMRLIQGHYLIICALVP